MKGRMFAAAAIAASLVVPQISLAATCPDMAAPVINAPGAAGAKCQSALAKFASKYIKTKMKNDSKCAMGFDELACPDAAFEAKNIATAQKSIDKIASACDEASLTALSSSYNVGSAGGITGAVAGSCLLSQNNVEAKVMVGVSNGAPAAWSGAKEREKCAQAVSKAAGKYVSLVLKTANKCIDGQIKLGTAGDLSPICVGSYSAGSYVAPTDAKTAAKIAKAVAKAESSIQKSCGDNPIAAANIETLFSCEGASTADDLKNCVVCSNWGNMMNVLTQQYSETGSLVQGTIQGAIDAASPGDKFLIPTGDYDEEVVIVESVDGDHDDIQLVGCGGATDERPTITPPVSPVGDRGIFTADVDGLVFQSLEPNGWPGDGIFNTGADGLTFRDIVADGEIASIYSIFPVQSSNVVVEVSEVTRVIDAGIYVGQTLGCTVRYNRVTENIAGIEIENSDNCDVYGNVATGNNAGILVFKLTSPALQISTNHNISHNVSSDNNFDGSVVAPGIVGLVPSGVGYISISNDTGDFHHNLGRENGSFGFAFLDQLVVNALVGSPVFNPPSVDQKAENNTIRDNQFFNNGNNPDVTPPNNTPLTSNLVFALDEDSNHNNCFTNNAASGALFLTPSDCTP